MGCHHALSCLPLSLAAGAQLVVEEVAHKVSCQPTMHTSNLTKICKPPGFASADAAVQQSQTDSQQQTSGRLHETCWLLQTMVPSNLSAELQSVCKHVILLWCAGSCIYMVVLMTICTACKLSKSHSRWLRPSLSQSVCSADSAATLTRLASSMNGSYPL